MPPPNGAPSSLPLPAREPTSQPREPRRTGACSTTRSPRSNNSFHPTSERRATFQGRRRGSEGSLNPRQELPASNPHAPSPSPHSLLDQIELRLWPSDPGPP